MRKLLLGAAMALGFAAPSLAHAQSGHVEAAYTNLTYDFGSEFEVEATGIGGQVAFGGAPVGVQVDARYVNWSGDADDVDVLGIGGHVFKRHESWLIGAYLGYDEIEDFNFEAVTGAVEAQFYMPRSTISGALSHSQLDFNDYAVTMLEGEYRHFVTDNFSIHGGLGFGQGDIGSADPDVWGGEVGAEYQFAGAPLSLFGFYRRSSMDFDPGEIDVDTFSIGVRYNWGGTLFDRNRSGAGLNRVTPIFERFIT